MAEAAPEPYFFAHWICIETQSTEKERAHHSAHLWAFKCGPAPDFRINTRRHLSFALKASRRQQQQVRFYLFILKYLSILFWSRMILHAWWGDRSRLANATCCSRWQSLAVMYNIICTFISDQLPNKFVFGLNFRPSSFQASCTIPPACLPTLDKVTVEWQQRTPPPRRGSRRWSSR